MRTRKEIEKDADRHPPAYLTLEVLLDVRELLEKVLDTIGSMDVVLAEKYQPYPSQREK